MIDFNFENENKIKRGSILISEPFLDDDYFSRAVVLVCDHNDEGSFGFVLNKYVESSLADFIEGFPENHLKLSIGGPVDTDNLFYVHKLGNTIEDSIPIDENLSIGGKFEDIKSTLGTNPELIKNIRFFIGYSGWEKNQLNEEIREKSWIVLNNISIDTIMDAGNEDIWNEIMVSLGGKFKMMSKFPINPANN